MSTTASDCDKWSNQAKLYSDQFARLTEMHGADLIALLKDDILQSKTILEIGCGTGAFAKAYVRQFPTGVPGQTLILSDISAGMLEKAKETIQPRDDFATKIVFQEEDGTTLEGIANDSVDLVVSLFGVFLIPEQDMVCKAVRRVVKKPEGVVAIVSWQFGLSDMLANQAFGVSLQDAFEIPVAVVSPETTCAESPIKQWASHEGAKKILSENYKMERVDLFGALHTMVCDFDLLWTMLLKNPVSNLEAATDDDAKKAKEALIKFVTRNGKSPLDKPLMFSTASNLCVGRGLRSERVQEE